MRRGTQQEVCRSVSRSIFLPPGRNHSPVVALAAHEIYEHPLFRPPFLPGQCRSDHYSYPRMGESALGAWKPSMDGTWRKLPRAMESGSGHPNRCEAPHPSLIFALSDIHHTLRSPSLDSRRIRLRYSCSKGKRGKGLQPRKQQGEPPVTLEFLRSRQREEQRRRLGSTATSRLST